MYLAGGILQDHPVASTVGQSVMIVVAIISFVWAYRITKPVTKRDATDLRQTKGESQVGLRAMCNPGRRSNDRCSVCPLDKRCLKSLPPLNPEEIIRDQAALLAVTEKAAASRPQPTVLFVDDNEQLGLMTQTLLASEGVACRVATSMEDALPIGPHEMLLVTDYRFPEGTPETLIAHFREAHPGKPVIVVSALEHAPEGMPTFITWVTKPFEVDAFLSLVKQRLKG